MHIPQVRKYLCVVCKKNEIVEHRTEHTYEGDVPDQCNCDLSTHDGYHVSGGKLLKQRQEGCWTSLSTNMLAVGPGGICEDCLKNEIVRALLPHLGFNPWT